MTDEQIDLLDTSWTRLAPHAGAFAEAFYGRLFELDPRLAADTAEIGRLLLCRVLLMNDRNFPWLVLVPQKPALREIHELAESEQQLLVREISHVSSRLQTESGATKMNIAALGNQVPQLHIHVIARFDGDPAWPAPVWGRIPPSAYPADELEEQKFRLRHALELD